MKKRFVLLLILLSNLFIFGQEYSVTAKSGLVIRDKPSLKSNRLGKFEENRIIRVVRKTDVGLKVEKIEGFWYQIEYNDSYAYVFSGFLKPLTDSTPQEMALNFYKWYLKNHYEQGGIYETPNIEMASNNTFYLDYKGHKESLKSTGYFSEKYFENNLLVYKECEKALLKVNHDEVEACGCNPAEFTEGNCVFSFYYVWTNGQGEYLNTAGLDSYTTSGNNVLVVISIGYTSRAESHEYSKARVLMVNENGKWKISKIEV